MTVSEGMLGAHALVTAQLVNEVLVLSKNLDPLKKNNQDAHTLFLRS